jgi:hypothetical protein
LKGQLIGFADELNKASRKIFKMKLDDAIEYNLQILKVKSNPGSKVLLLASFVFDVLMCTLKMFMDSFQKCVQIFKYIACIM